jgi:uncharacterized protein YodC (DUF2158 family)
VKRFTYRKSGGDDRLSYAIFDGGVACRWLNGMSRQEARWRCAELNAEHEKKREQYTPK